MGARVCTESRGSAEKAQRAKMYRGEISANIELPRHVDVVGIHGSEEPRPRFVYVVFRNLQMFELFGRRRREDGG